MAAAARNGTMIFRGQSGKTYAVNVYCSDVSGAYVTFSYNGAAGTGSTNFITAPENVVLSDYSIVTGVTDTTVLVAQSNDTNKGVVIAQANHVNTIATRPQNLTGWQAGSKISFTQA